MGIALRHIHISAISKRTYQSGSALEQFTDRSSSSPYVFVGGVQGTAVKAVAIAEKKFALESFTSKLWRPPCSNSAELLTRGGTRLMTTIQTNKDLISKWLWFFWAASAL